MNENLPTVSIVIPVYNREKLVLETLNSLLKQSESNFQCIIIDDHSTDNSFSIIEQFIASDKRFQLLKRKSEKKGAPVCRNEGLEVVKSKFVIFLDSDDILAEHCIKLRVQQLIAKPELDFAVFLTQAFQNQIGDKNILLNRPNNKPALLRFLELDIPWLTTSVIWKKSSLEQLQGWNESLLSSQDWDLFVRALKAKMNFQYFDWIDCFWRLNHSNSIGKNASNSAEYLLNKAELYKTIQVKFKGQKQYNSIFVALFFYLARTAAYYHNRELSTKIWKIALDQKLLSSQAYFQGLILLKTMQVRGLRSVVDILMNKLKHPFFQVGFSTSYLTLKSTAHERRYLGDGLLL